MTDSSGPSPAATPSARAPLAVRPRRRRRTALTVLALLLAAGAVLVEARSVLWFHTARPWSTPPRIHFCGRDYRAAGIVPPAAAATQVPGVPLRRLTWGPLGQPVYGHPAADDARARLGVPCSMDLFIGEDGGYRSYSLVGGP